MYSTPGYCSEAIYIYYTRIDSKANAPHRDEGELLNVTSEPFGKMLGKALSGDIEDAKTALGIILASKLVGIV